MEAAPAKTRTCVQCTREFPVVRSTAKYCSPTCRSRARRAQGSGAAEAVAGLVDQTVGELLRLGKLDSVMGQHALILARRMESPFETLAAVAAGGKELSRLMAVAAAKGAAEDPVDDVKRKRDEKAARARSASR